MQTCKHLYAQNTGRFELSGQFTLLTWTCDSYKRVTVEENGALAVQLSVAHSKRSVGSVHNGQCNGTS